MLYVAQTALELGFQYALVAMALFLSYRVLDIADLTTDGCFVLGCAVSVTLTAAGTPLPGHPRRHAGRGLRRVCHRLPPDQAGGALHPGGHRHQHGALHRQSDGHGVEGQPVPAQAGYYLHPLPRHRHRRRLEPHPSSPGGSPCWRVCCWWPSWAPGWASASAPPATTGTWCAPPPSTPISPSPSACAWPTPSPACPAQ